MALLVATACCVQAADMDARVEALLARMTLEEKLGQMSQSTSMATLTDEFKTQIRAGRWGSFLNAGSAADRAEAQRIATEESRLKIPLIFGRDVIHGYETVFPIPLGQAATWDADLIRASAREAAREAAAQRIAWTFAPMIDIARDPRWGRIAESLGEDPYLTGELGVAMVRGFQGETLDAADSLAACAKHFVGYGAAEAGRDYNSTWIPEILLRDVYLRPFRATQDAGVASFMTAFNTLNAVPATADRFLLRDILRDEWKYPGLVVSDYEAVTNLIAHGYATDNREAARKSINAGVEMEMVSTTFYDDGPALLRSGKITMKEIDDSVRDILRLKFRLGLFDQRATPEAPDHAHTLAVAEQAASESVVLLQNNHDVLPLAKSIAKIAVIGPLADSPVDQMGTWSMDGRADFVQTPLAALRGMLGADRVVYARALVNSRDSSHNGFAEAVNAARGSDAVVLFLGEEAILSGEARSRAFLNLPGAQEALVDAIAAVGKPTIAVILAGRPLTFHDAALNVGAVLYAWHPGAMGGPAIAKLLFGDASPSGKLPVTFPRTVGQVPIYYEHLTTGRPASASDLGVPMGNPADPQGYTSKYIDVDFTPEYPFGFGLSYANFRYSETRLSAKTLSARARLKISAEVTNLSHRAADEIVELYTSGPAGGSVARPVRELKGFRRVHLEAGEVVPVEFTIGTADLAYYNDRMQFVTEPGEYRAWIAPDSSRGTVAVFSVK
jgi:beta-glucosidase